MCGMVLRINEWYGRICFIDGVRVSQKQNKNIISAPKRIHTQSERRKEE